MEKTNDEQVPWEASSLTGDFFFNLGKEEVVPPVQSTQFELELWNAVRDSVNVSEFEAYLTKFPNGMFASAAEQRIRYLTEEKQAWIQALSDARVASLETFLNQFPNGAFAELARTKLAAYYNRGIVERAALDSALPKENFEADGKWRIELNLNEGSCEFNLDKKIFIEEMNGGKLNFTSYIEGGGYLTFEIKKTNSQSVASALLIDRLVSTHAKTEIIIHDKTVFDLDSGILDRHGGRCDSFSVHVAMNKL